MIAERRLAQTQPACDARLVQGVPSRMIGPTATQPAGTLDEIQEQLPDPLNMMPALRGEREGADARPPDVSEVNWQRSRQVYYNQALSWVQGIRRPNAVDLSLDQAVARALKNSYAIQIQSYNPAIESTQIVEAEAQFDAVFFTTFSYNKQDQPTGTVPPGNEVDTRIYQGGIRKLLSTGMQVSASYGLTRSWTNLATGTFNPSYFNQFIVDFNQPLLRGFGLDYNRSRIENARLERDKSIEVLRRNIRETLFNVEQSYWRLYQARRNVAIAARLLSKLEQILTSFRQRERAGFDVYPVQVQQVESRIYSRRRSSCSSAPMS